MGIKVTKVGIKVTKVGIKVTKVPILLGIKVTKVGIKVTYSARTKVTVISAATIYPGIIHVTLIQDPPLI